MVLSYRLSLALAISIGLHLLMLWFVASYSQAGINSFRASSLSIPIRITLVNPRDVDTENVQNPSVLPLLPVDGDKANRQVQQTQGRDNGNIRKPASLPNQTDTLTKPINTRPISTARIKTTAAAIARQFTEHDKNEVSSATTSISAKLDRALNKQQEAPGVSTLADGSTRVVTEYGTTYCVKSIEDWRINGPEDDMSVSMYCK